MDEPFFEVKVEGEIFSDLVESVVIEESDAQTDMATIVFDDSNLVLSDILHEGLTVELDVGRRVIHTVIFRGIITGIRANFVTDGEPKVEIQAMDSLIQLSFEPKTKRWWNKPISTIVLEIAGMNGLIPGIIQPTVDTLIDESRPIHQIEETDLAFLLRLARDYDAKLSVAHFPIDTLNFISTRTLVNSPPIPELLMLSTNLREFTASFDAFATMSNKQVVTTDPITGSRVAIPPDPVLIAQDEVAVLEATWIPNSFRLLGLGLGAIRFAKLIAKSAAKRTQLNNYWQDPPRVSGAASRLPVDMGETFGDWSRRLGQIGQGLVRGSILLRPRVNVLIEGCGGRWSGKWYLSEVEHRFDARQRNYTCEFTCTR